MKQDRMLLGILIGIAFLVVLALGLFFTRKSTLEYGEETTPEGVVRNYMVAVLKRDYEKAYTYLSEAENKPAFNKFEWILISQEILPNRPGLIVGKTRIIDNRAFVELTVLHENRGLFESPSSDYFLATLWRDIGGSWKLLSMPPGYWGNQWYIGNILDPEIIP